MADVDPEPRASDANADRLLDAILDMTMVVINLQISVRILSAESSDINLKKRLLPSIRGASEASNELVAKLRAMIPKS